MNTTTARKSFRVALIIATFVLLCAVLPYLTDGWVAALGQRP